MTITQQDIHQAIRDYESQHGPQPVNAKTFRRMTRDIRNRRAATMKSQATRFSCATMRVDAYAMQQAQNLGDVLRAETRFADHLAARKAQFAC